MFESAGFESFMLLMVILLASSLPISEPKNRNWFQSWPTHHQPSDLKQNLMMYKIILRCKIYYSNKFVIMLCIKYEEGYELWLAFWGIFGWDLGVFETNRLHEDDDSFRFCLINCGIVPKFLYELVDFPNPLDLNFKPVTSRTQR